VPDAQKMNGFCEDVIDMVDHIRQEIAVVDFWPAGKHKIINWIINEVDDLDLIPFEKRGKVADPFTDLAKAIQTWLVAS